MNRLLIFFILPLHFSLVSLTVADEADDDVKPQTGKQAVITLDSKKQQLSGIETRTLEPVKHQTEFIATGRAISIQPLMDLHNGYLTALTEHHSATAILTQAEQSINRQQDLYRHGVSSKRSLQEQQAVLQTDKAQAEAIRIKISSIRSAGQLSWGKTLTEWALSEDTEKLTEFLLGHKTLLQITLPADKQLANDLASIHVDSSGNRSKAQKAKLISPAPLTGASTQGASYFFETDAKNIRIGMNVSAWIAEQGTDRLGVVIPKSALLWSMNQAFVYVKTGKDTFSRRTIDHYSLTGEGYFTEDAVKPNEVIVTTGAGMLLSEEMRGQIPGDDD